LNKIITDVQINRLAMEKQKDSTKRVLSQRNESSLLMGRIQQRNREYLLESNPKTE